MNSNNLLTIAQVLELKGGTIKELCEYANTKGIDLPNDANYILSPAQIKAIDPILAYKLKYVKSVSGASSKQHSIATNEESTSGNCIFPSELPPLNDATILFKPINESLLEQNRDIEKNKEPKRLIGIIKFFDAHKGFGYIVTNNKEINESQEYIGRLYSFYVSYSEWRSSSTPKNRDWVVFTPNKNDKGQRNAINVVKLQYDKDSLLLSMKYRGYYAKIAGQDSHSEEKYNHHILCHIIKNIIKGSSTGYALGQASASSSEAKYSEIISTFLYYLSTFHTEQRNTIVHQFTCDDELKNILCRLFLRHNYTAENDDLQLTYNEFKDCLINEIIETKSITSLELLPYDFNDNRYAEQITHILISESVKNSVQTHKWLLQHSDTFTELTLDNHDIQTIPLRFILLQITQDTSWITNMSIQWELIAKHIKQCNNINVIDFCKVFYADKDIIFLTTYKIIELLDKRQIEELLYSIIDEEIHSLDVVLNSLIKDATIGNIALLEDYITHDRDITGLYGSIQSITSSSIIDDADATRAFLDLCEYEDYSIQTLFPIDATISDELRIELFVRTNAHNYIEQIKNFNACSTWIIQQPADFIATFILKYASLNNAQNSTIIISLGEATIVAALKMMNEQEQLRILNYLPKELATNVATNYFVDSKLFYAYIGKQWTELKSHLSYVVFDLETDGDTIHEFAFKKTGYTTYDESEFQIDSLIDAINTTPIIVGHNIKQWDLPILQQSHTLLAPAFIWDTLEMEILINPCRYAYSLDTAHNAKDDTELTDKLFWNQLFRLASDEDLCLQLSEFLPTSIEPILEQLRLSHFTHFLKETCNSEVLFQNLLDIDDNLITKLKTINEECNNQNAVIIAPQRLWNRIAEYIHLSFIRHDNKIDYLSLSEAKLIEQPLDDHFLQTVFIKFCQKSVTPIVANLAPYLRSHYFSNDDILSNYVTDTTTTIQCTDLSLVDSIAKDTNYTKIYFIGCELENRLNCYQLPDLLNPTDFWNQKTSIPMRMGGSSFTSLTTEERNLDLFSEVPKDATNVWLERMCNGKYSVNYNFNIYHKLCSLNDKYGDKIIQIPWMLQKNNNNSIFLVRSSRPQHFDYTQKRVNSTSPYRSMYWMYQLALLNSIHSTLHDLPIIYILEDKSEIENVQQYAATFDYYIPKDGTLVSQLDKIAKHRKGLLIVDKDRFFEIADKRLHTAYCYIWDQMAVEKHRMMWQNQGAIGESTLNDKIVEIGSEIKSGSNKDTYQTTLLSIWPVFQYYYQFIAANNINSQMYILDSFLEEYHTISNIIGCADIYSTTLWNDEATFQKDLEHAQCFFSDSGIDKVPQDEKSINKAMDVILATLVPEHNGKRAWTDIQKQVLPEILSKKENYLVSIPTGGGKSVLFQGPALYNTSYTNRLSLVVTPLKALMQDQVRELAEKGFYTNVDYLNGDRTYQETKSIYRKINSGELAILYVTPERFRSRTFLNALITRMTHDHGLEYMVFDEAHCISQWGMEFRPEYLNVIKKCKDFSENYGYSMCIAMFSATVTDMIYNQINQTIPIKRLGQNNDKKIYNPIRNHIATSFQLVNHDTSSRLDAIVKYIISHDIRFDKSRMLVFCKTRKQCEEVAVSLANLLVKAKVIPEKNYLDRVWYFHAGLDADDRDDIYTKFKSSEEPIYILCATKAFGMGMDIPNIHYIIHLCPPNVLEDYLQEVGRAGRNKDMYQQVGFSEENPIPTVCLYSKEDIRKSREQLLQSMLSWQDLEKIRTKILEYIQNIQSIEKTKEYPIVLPNNLWKNSDNDYEYTDFRLGEYWLERMNRIKMGYLSPAHITISILERNANNIVALNSQAGIQTKRIHSTLVSIADTKGNNTIQVSLQQIAGDLSIHSTKVLNELITCVKYKLIAINQEVMCRIAKTRYDEIPYMLNHESIEVAFHIIINAAESILRDNTINREKTYFDKEIRPFVDTTPLDNITQKVTRKINNTTEQCEYLPWYNEKDKNIGLSIAKNYKKDLWGKRFKHIFITLLDIVPGVKCKSYIDREAKAVKQSILVENNTWKTFLPKFRSDCLRTLEYIYKRRNNSLNWADAINELHLEHEGYLYFDNILRYLSCMAYIVTENLLPTGIEVYTTDNSEKQILDEDSVLDSSDYENKKAFDETLQIRNLRLCVMDVLTTKIKNQQDFQDLISAYFSKTDANGFIELLSKYYPDDDPIWDTIRETAIKSAEEQMKDNSEQWKIYNENPDINVNVEAGPGSGKTHVLTMRCAKLIYRQHIRPDQILVLAYNRAVVVELKSRLLKLFTSLGLSRSAAQLHVYTFHGLAKKICGDKALENLEMAEWETYLLRLLKEQPMEVTKVLNDIRYVLIDEFQDITQTRLDAIFELNKIYRHPAFFTIGDKDQSIYGFEKKESMNPNYYYEQLREELRSKTMSMFTNYRSYPKILEEAARFLPKESKLPHACQKNIDNAPKEAYTFIFNNKRNWVEDFPRIIRHLKQKQMTDVAIFFRTNSEVYRGYAQIRSMNIPNVRIRIQGASECELFRKREIYAVVHMLEKKGNTYLRLEKDESKLWIKGEISKWINNLPNWDSFYMDFAYILVLDYLDFAQNDEARHTYAEMAESIKTTLSEDNPQLYKLYDKYQSERILQDLQMNVVLTTMHKVKGLEFDAVIVTPSLSSLPFEPTKSIDITTPMTPYETECIKEEQRLLYVAFTRAKKFLMAYLGERENAVLHLQKYQGKDDTLGIKERQPGLDNYNIGFNAGINFQNNTTIVHQVEKNAPVTIQRFDCKNKMGQDFHVYNIMYNGIKEPIGQLSKSSTIAKAMDANHLSSLSGYFVSDIYYWTYQDSVLADQKNLKSGHTTDFASKWYQAAKEKGFIFIVSIAGYGN